MGYWGIGLDENDTVLDVKDAFEERWRYGTSIEEINSYLIESFSDLKSDLNEERLFWIALADIQWEYGVLLPEVRDKALHCIDSGGDLELWKGNFLDYILRKIVLFKLKYKLLSPQPPAKKRVGLRAYKCKWKIGDVYSYKLESEFSKEKGLYGRHLLIQKIDEDVGAGGCVIPIVYVKITEDDKLPSSFEEYDALEYVQIDITPYEQRFFPIDGRRPKEDIARKSKLKYEVDDYGYLPQFRAELNNNTKKIIPQKLLYIGNYKNAKPPLKEFIHHEKMNTPLFIWKEFDGVPQFEEGIIKCYTRYNLRQSSAYRDKKRSAEINDRDKEFMNTMMNILEKKNQK